MAWFNPFSWLRSDNLPTTYNEEGGRHFYSFGGKTIYFDLCSEKDYLKAYTHCSPVKAIINRRASMFANGKLRLLNKSNDNDLRGDYARDILAKLEQPNPLQSWHHWWTQHNIFTDLFGYCPYIIVRPTSMPDAITNIWNIPPWLFDYDMSGKWKNQTDIKQIFSRFYMYDFNGNKEELPHESVFITLDSGVGTDSDGNLLLPDGRLKGLELAVSNEVAAKTSDNTLLSKNGGIGILSNGHKDQMGSLPMDPQEKEELHKEFGLGGLVGQRRSVIITSAALTWQPMASPKKDLMIFETLTASQSDLCDGLGMYAYVMSAKNSKGTTFTNLSEAKKAQYQDFIIPDGDSRIHQISRSLIPTEKNAYLHIDFSHVEALQQTEKEKAEALKVKAQAYQALYNLGIITQNMILERLGENKVPGKPEMDLYSWEKTPTNETGQGSNKEGQGNQDQQSN